MAGIFQYKFDLQLLLIPTTEIMTQVKTVTLRTLGKRSWSRTRAFPGFSPGTKTSRWRWGGSVGNKKQTS